MGISRTDNHFLGDVRKAYAGLSDRRAPSAAIKLKFPDQAEYREKIINIIRNTLRGTDKVFFRGDNTYAILMRDTPFKGAISASTRLALRLRRLNDYISRQASDPVSYPSLHILGSRKGATDIQAARLDIVQRAGAEACPEEEADIPIELRTYIKWSRLATHNNHLINQQINIKA